MDMPPSDPDVDLLPPILSRARYQAPGSRSFQGQSYSQVYERPLDPAREQMELKKKRHKVRSCAHSAQADDGSSEARSSVVCLVGLAHRSVTPEQMHRGASRRRGR